MLILSGHRDTRGEDAGASQHKDGAPDPGAPAQDREIQGGEEGEYPGPPGGDSHSQMQVRLSVPSSRNNTVIIPQ